MSVFDDLQQKHENLLKHQHDGKDIIKDVKEYIELVRNGGSKLTSVHERDQMRANLRYWAGYVFEQEKIYPNVDLAHGATIIGSSQLRTMYLIVSTTILLLIVATILVLQTDLLNSLSTPINTPIQSNVVIYDRTLAPGYSLNIDNSSHSNGWIGINDESILAGFLPDQAWSVVYITFGTPRPPGQRDGSLNLSSCLALSIDLRADQEEVDVYVGMKDAQDPDDGSETLIPLIANHTWQSHTVSLSRLATADLRQIYIPFEVVYFERNAATVLIDKVRLQCQE